ncbi:unnamed protein product [Rhizoctonia solani]|uniref:F-box domain-containing protein n=1 Tax=Rhizoctonia solani TaxID=456999 RepID=A0A8H3CUT6_9AGAM|nr:unnamed protein product [Rhizoctonia solani]
MQFNDLPFEIIQQIFRQIPPTRDSLSPASLVCKAWREIILPLLFNEIRLSNEGQNSFIKRILDETKDTSTKSKLSNYVRRLVICRPMDEQELRELGLAIQIMKNLEHITWNTSPLSSMGWDSTIGLLQQKSPQLRSLRLIITQDAHCIKLKEGIRPELLLPQAGAVETGEYSDSEQVNGFPNLQRLFIEFDESHSSQRDGELRIPPEIPYLIRGARNIESLHLDFRQVEVGSIIPLWGLDQLFSLLPLDYFPNLRSIQILSSHLQDIDHFVGPEFRRFIASHNQLKQVVITSFRQPHPNSPQTTTSRDVERLMPSVCYFGGTGSSVDVFLQSSLAGKLEGLELTVHYKKILQTQIPELPRLKKLLIRSFYSQTQGREPWNTMLRALDQLAPKTPYLRKLTIRVDNLWKSKYDSIIFVTSIVAGAY